ncbi:dihydroorotase [Desulfovibrio desulfuricans]|uniref:Dihydroorotase n=1 Tax=Desulfovibrio desulfuricans TaxID=876 RepID=A0A4P7UN54_DESDE|nr:dihydroorotase [Desulfovibrio desulfuricans]QCC86304.1 dihydroorotase [Desulfovibrio desulfuricans]
MSLLIKNARHLGAPVDLLVRHGKIVTMTPAGHKTYDSREVFDAQGLMLMPSCTDAHAHLREPGFEYKEDIASGLEAAARGGFATIMCMANTRPVNDSASVTRAMLDSARKSHPQGPRLCPIAAATVGLKGEEMSPLAELKDAGCVAVSNDGRPLENAELVRRIMEYGADLDLVLIDHCEDPHLAKGWRMHEGVTSGLLGVKGQPAAGEANQAMRDIMLAEYLQIPVHIAHVSAALTVDCIAWGKARGVKVTAETCPHYLLLDETALEGYNTQAKVSPPLRTAADREALRRAVKDGTIDILATDHAPHAAHEKEGTLDDAMCGFTGLDLAVSLTWGLVTEGVLNEADLHRLWSQRPAEIFNLPRNGFAPGDPADFFLFDPAETWVPSPQNLYSKSCNTPFLGKPLQGRVKHHWIGGQQLF